MRPLIRLWFCLSANFADSSTNWSIILEVQPSGPKGSKRIQSGPKGSIILTIWDLWIISDKSWYVFLKIRTMDYKYFWPSLKETPRHSCALTSIGQETWERPTSATLKDHCQLQEWYEGFLKDCPSGELSKEKFIAMYSKIFPRFEKTQLLFLIQTISSGNAENFSQNIFRTFDTNNSGTIDFRLVKYHYRMQVHISMYRVVFLTGPP